MAGGAGARDDDVFEIVITASEAFANAVEHPRVPTHDVVEVEAGLVAEWITVRVRDYGSWQHERLRPGDKGFLSAWSECRSQASQRTSRPRPA